jgi:hypothetical protein
MVASLRALLAGVIDYAGLFPPAKLPLDEAIRNYVRYRQEPESWMLGRFICPVGRLGDLAQFQPELFQADTPIALSVLVQGGNTMKAYVTGLQADLETIGSFQNRPGSGMDIDVLEVRFPEDVVRWQPADINAPLVLGASVVIETQCQAAVTPYYEVNLGPDWRASWAVIAGIARDNKEAYGREHCRPAGFKLRCGGLEASAFPSPEQVAFTIVACRDAGIALKFTAGLHHPIRRFDPGIQTHMHGFLNVFGAGVLAHARQLAEEQVRQIIEDEDPGNFAFSQEEFRWKDLRATTEEIVTARKMAVISFGSCSFDEPRDDLRALGLL